MKDITKEGLYRAMGIAPSQVKETGEDSPLVKELKAKNSKETTPAPVEDTLVAGIRAVSTRASFSLLDDVFRANQRWHNGG